MKKENQNRGFIATAVLYSVVIIVVLCLFIILRNLQTTRNIQRDTSSDIKKDLLHYEIIYDGNGHTSGSMQKQRVPAGEDVSLSKCLYLKDGYHFLGWTRNPTYACNPSNEGEQKCYLDEEVVRNLTEVSSEITLYAQWQGNQYTVTFDPTGGSISDSNSTKVVVFDSPYGPLPSATRDGYSFEGWYTDISAGEKILENTKVTKMQNHTLYARWKAVGMSDILVQDTDDCSTYDDGVETFLVGKCTHNYIWYSGKIWRAYAIHNETKNVKLVTDNSMTSLPYNSEGNLYFSGSFAETWLNNEFLSTLHHPSKYLVANSPWDSDEETTYYKKPEYKRPAGLNRSYSTVGLLNSYDYHKSYVSSNAYQGHFVLMTPYQKWIRGVDNYKPNTYANIVGAVHSYNSVNLRPVVWLKSNISSVSGNGEMSNPYRLEGDEQTTINGVTLLNTRYSGEYITFNNTLYRIVGIEGRLTKIVAVDLVASLGKVPFHTSRLQVTFANASIRTQLQNYYLSIPSQWRNLIQTNTAWYYSPLQQGTNYRNLLDASKTVRANIGLLRIGEMFVNGISREDGETRFWSLTPYVSVSKSYSDYYNAYTLSNRNADSIPFTTARGVRPSMYLKSTVKIARSNTGDGTYEKPYAIE